MAVTAKIGDHLKQDLDEAGIDNGEVSETLVKGERGEPFEDGGSGVRVRVRVWGLGMVEGNVRGERVHELTVSHESELTRNWNFGNFLGSVFS